MNNNKFIWNQLVVQENQKAYGLGNQILTLGYNKPMIGNMVEISKDNLTVNRSCDLNDFFRQYVCLFTNISGITTLDALDQFENSITYALMSKYEKEIILQINKGEVVKDVQNEGQKPKKGQQKQESPIEKIAALIFQCKKDYKDQLGNLGKIMQFKHPPLISINFVFPKQNINAPAIQPFISQELIAEEFEFISYHQSDADLISIINSHINQLITALKSNQRQILYFNDKTILPINKFADNSNLKLYSTDFINNKRLLIYEKQFNSLVYEENNKILNPHHYLSPKALDNGQRYLVRGDYVFHHYLQDGFDDKGWGCAYRSFQSVLSWLMQNGYTKKTDIPNHKKIQQLLVEMGDKPVSFVGTSEWIGAFEVSMLITQITKIECKILNITKGTDVVSKLSEFKNYFENYGAPIMFGGGLYAYTLLGIDYTEEDCRFLILDPHYTANDTIKSIIEKQGVSWRKADMFEEKNFYNFCMPLIQ